jgi:hypothetical protein
MASTERTARSALVDLANEFGDQSVGDAVCSVWPEFKARLDDAALQRAVDAPMADSGLPRYGPHRATIERRQRIAFEAVTHG